MKYYITQKGLDFINERVKDTLLPHDVVKRNEDPKIKAARTKRTAAAIARSIPNQDLVKLQHMKSV